MTEPRCRLWMISMLFAGAVAISACGGLQTPSANQTRDFSGVLPLGGTRVHDFDVSKSGELQAKLKSIQPVVTATVGLIIGQFVSGSCSPYDNSPFNGLNTAPLVIRVTSGRWCVAVYDSASNPLSQEATYTISVSSP
jgi:hypothetical protein